MGVKTGISTRVNGAPPPEIALADIHLESLDFWALDDDIREGAFATLRREAPSCGLARHRGGGVRGGQRATGR